MMGVNGEVQEIAHGIRQMKIRGAGEIARSAVQALMMTAERSTALTANDLIKDLNSTAKLLLGTRPTAVSLPNGIRYVMHRVMMETHQGNPVELVRSAAVKSAKEFIANSLSAIQRIGEIGAKRVTDGDKLLTHCNSAAVVAILKTAWSQGKRFEVTVTETRPRFQGRITAKELGSAGIPVTLILDDAVRFFMNRIDKVIVGADAITANGALVNKIGTSLIALSARETRTRVFAAAETYKFSPETMIGELIEIEERESSEVISSTDLDQLANTKVRNPAFDVTPAEYIDLIITERGIIPPQAAVLTLHEQYGMISPEELNEYHTVRISEQE
jgi:ribose 1,5-bisphosphate isomerase